MLQGLNDWTNDFITWIKDSGNYPQGSIRIQPKGSIVVGAKSITPAGLADLYITYTWIQIPNIHDL